MPDDSPDPHSLVSVGLVVRNAERTVSLAIRSLVAQTCPRWELLVADDGSGDRTMEIRQGFRDKRVRIIAHTEATGLAGRLNELVEVRRGKEFARRDGGDFAFPGPCGRQTR